MTAVILAGGDGVRMRPLTCSLPKAMLHICNLPLIEYIIRSLQKNGISDIIIAADRFSRVIADYFDRDMPIPPALSLSSVPEGTSAALQRAVEGRDLDGDEPVLVINGAALADFDYNGIICKHRSGGSALTLILKGSDRPWEGIAAVTENGLLTDVIRSMPRESCASGLVITGSFVVNAGLAQQFPKYGEDIYTDVLPVLLKQGKKIAAVREKGYFMRLVTPSDLLDANSDVINGVYPHTPETVITPEEAEKRFSGVSVSGKVCIGENNELCSGVVLEGGTVIGNNVSVGKGTKLRSAVIGDGVQIGEGCTVNCAVIGKAVHLSSGASVFEGAAVGEDSVISENAVVNPGVKIWKGRRVEPFACAAADLKYGFARPVIIDDEGITGETGSELTPQTAAVIGSSLASLGRKIAVGCKDDPASQALAMALASGIMAAGGEVRFAGETTEPELASCVRLCGAAAGCFIGAGITTKIKFFSSDGLPLSRREEKLIEGGVNRGEYRRSGFSRFGAMRYCPEIRELYMSRLYSMLPERLRGIRAVVNTPGKRVSEICTALLEDINDKNGKPIVFHISGDGAKTSAYTEETGYIFPDKLIMLCCKTLFEQGRDTALPYSFPVAAERLAERYGCKVLRYSGCPGDGSDREARRLAAENGFSCDGIVLMLKTLDILSEKKQSLKEACEELPEFAEVNRFVAIDMRSRGRMELLRQLCTEKISGGDGVVINDKRGRVLIRPVKTGKGLMMHVESYKLETASELCDFYQETLNTMVKRGENRTS
ncbi:MAG: NTP transferase domain-containing protein [Oscillospiraceae bacterium]|nr:NTP transferase domain-containing protein [Oscillospiraceae bacterium]